MIPCDRARSRCRRPGRLQERLEKVFERRFVLPPEADTEHLAAEFGEGVLIVHAPKLTEIEPRKVAIGKK